MRGIVYKSTGNLYLVHTDSNMIYMHGTDSNGQPTLLTFDTSSPGSIESGRGFLNFSFLLIFTIVFGVMACSINEGSIF